MMGRQYSFLDEVIGQVDKALRSITGNMPPVMRDNPAQTIKRQPKLSENDRQHAAALMRVNHAGEVCAQALYQGQALTAQSKTIQKKLQKSAEEENDHLHWCQERINELQGHVSYLNFLWYTGSFGLGILAGLFGDPLNLGFLAETEKQVVKHIDTHLKKLPRNDEKSRQILMLMREDENHHATTAIKAGGRELPQLVKKLMKNVSSFMTFLAYYI